MLPLVAWCLKNLIIFGFFGTSSWAGMSLWTKTNGYAPEQLAEFHARGLISAVAVRADQQPFQADRQFHARRAVADCCVSSPGRLPRTAPGRLSQFQPHRLCRTVPSAWPRCAEPYSPRSVKTFWHRLPSGRSVSPCGTHRTVQALFQDNMALLEPLERFYRSAFFGFLDVKSRHSDPRVWLRTSVRGLLFAGFML